MRLYNCDCEYEEINNNVKNEVKGYTLTSKCQVCINRDNQNAIRETKVKEIQEKRNLLISTDYKVIRHREQKDINVSTTLSDAEYNNLLATRNLARKTINELENIL